MKMTEKFNGILLKLGKTDDPKYPESNGGNSPQYGTFVSKPQIGKSFFLNKNRTIFTTSLIKNIVSETDSEIIFNTKNSCYQLTINLFDNIFDEICN